jgi:hypothetical protein
MSFLKQMWGLISDSVARGIRIDASTHSLTTIDYAHKEIHSGSTFTTTRFVAGLGNGATSMILLKTPDTTKYAHLLYEFNSTVDGSFTITAEVTTVADGTLLNILNRDRNSATTATCVATHTPNTPSGGTIIRQRYIGVGGVNRTGGTDRNTDEIILRRNTKYLFTFTNGAASNNVSLILNWYEHTDRN